MSHAEILNLSPPVLATLRKHISDIEGDTFVIAGLPPELTGGLLARYSRAPTGLRETFAREFIDGHGNLDVARAKGVMDRVLVQVGDESVGELEGAHVGIEYVTQLVTKSIEDRRIGGSPIEQSTRYVRYDAKVDDRWRYLVPKEIKGSSAALQEKFIATNDAAFELYSEAIKRLIPHFETVLPRTEYTIPVKRGNEEVKLKESELSSDEERKAFRNAYGFTIRCAALDVARAVLPNSTLTHLGVFGNGRYFTHLISNLESGALVEEQERASSLERELNKSIPTFIKRHRNLGLRQRDVAMNDLTSELFSGMVPEYGAVTLVPRESDDVELISSVLFPYSNLSFEQINKVVRELPFERKADILKTYAGERKTRRDRTGRGTEAGYPLTFDIVGTFAEYRDLERHRMLLQQRQPIGALCGFFIPPEFDIVSLSEQAKEVADRSADLYSVMRHDGLEAAAQYAPLFNHRMRFMLGMNARELQHLAELRSQPAGHYGYRSIVQSMTKQAVERNPLLGASGMVRFVDYSDPGNKIARAHEQGRIAGKSIGTGIDTSGDLV